MGLVGVWNTLCDLNRRLVGHDDDALLHGLSFCGKTRRWKNGLAFREAFFQAMKNPKNEKKTFPCD